MNKNETGFTLIEILIVVFITGVLAAIVAPSWSAFLNRQRLKMGTEQIYLFLQEGQTKAQQQNRDYRVSFRNNNGMPQAAVNLDVDGTPTDANGWEDMINKNNLLTLDLTDGGFIVFNYDATIDEDKSEITQGESIVMQITNQGNAVQECVMIQTLLGTLQKAKDTQCN